MSDLSPSDTLQRRQNLVTQEVDGEIVILNLDNGEYYGLTKTSVLIWDLLEQPQTAQAIITAMVEAFDADEATIRDDVMEFLASLLEEGVVELADS